MTPREAKHSNYRPIAGACVFCGEKMDAYETKVIHLDGRIACGECAYRQNGDKIAGSGWFMWSDG